MLALMRRLLGGWLTTWIPDDLFDIDLGDVDE